EATTLRKEVALATGVGEATVAYFQIEYVDVIRDQILARNKSNTPLSLQTLIIELSKLEIKSELVVSCWRKYLGKARNYQEMVKVGICDESDKNEDENLDLYSENEDSDNKN
ncbi:11401_t:CDS:2, partial [Racocetra persica]